MTVPMYPVWIIDILGSSAWIVLSLYAVSIMSKARKRRYGMGIYRYLHAQTIALAIFAVSRSAGHILKHILLTTGYSGLWKALAPVSGSVNSLTFVVFGLSALLYSNVKETSDRMDSLEKSRREVMESEKKYRNLVESSPDMIFMLDAVGRILSVNQAGCSTLGYTAGELLQKNLMELVPAGEVPEARAGLQMLEKKGHVTYETTLLTRDGRNIPTEVNAVANYEKGGEFVSALGILRDLTERKRTEGFIKDILESVEEEFLVIDPEYRIMVANKAFCRHREQSPEDIRGSHCYEITHHADSPCYEMGEECPVRHTFETGEPCTVTHVHHDSQGKNLYLEIKSYPMKNHNGRVISVIELMNDVTERRGLETQLRQSQKMEAIGTLSGGIAHDFNNIITVIMGFGEFLKDEIGDDHPGKPYLDMILDSAENAANLTQGLLAFSRKQILNPCAVDLDEIAMRSQKLLARLIGEDIELRVFLSGKEVTVMADSAQIEQALLNLATNARDAMPEGGVLTISTDSAYLDQEYMNKRGYGIPGNYGVLIVGDTGIGMDAETRERIFEPFFTTKDIGRGTGLGLATVYGIIKQHNGHINVYSEPGRGTNFKIYLPVAAATEQERKGTASPSRGGSETVLVAEDDPDVRLMVRKTLERAGYRVLEAVDGEAAVTLFDENRDGVDLLLFDVVMPKLNGKKACELIHQSRPDVRALFMSGYNEDIIHRKGVLEKGIDFVSKPVMGADLLRYVREILDRQA